jgi:hypothetical protein
MANGASQAVTEITRLNEIGFVEFTTQLINGVFDALINANIRQTEQYIALLQSAATTLADYINNTEDDISPQDILAFLERVGVAPGQPVEDPVALNAALLLPASAGVTGNNQVTVTAGATPSTTVFQRIQEAAAKRIAANRFELLQEMVKQGVLRLIVDNGVIETRLTFTTYGKSQRSESTAERNREESTSASGGGLGLGFGAGAGGFGFGAATGGTRSTLNISTAKAAERDVTGSRVQIYGRVKIHFKTDYAPLAPR